MEKRSDNTIIDDLNNLRIKNEQIFQFLNSKKTGGDYVGFDNIPIPSMSLTDTDKTNVLEKLRSFGTIVQKIGNDIHKRYGNELEPHIQNLVNTQTIALQTIVAIQDGRINEYNQGLIISAVINFQNSILNIRGHAITLDSHDPTGKGFRKLQKKESRRSYYLSQKSKKIIIAIIVGVLGISGATYAVHITNVQSTGQSGGITAGQVIINNTTINNNQLPPPRQLNDQVIAQLNQFLPQNNTRVVHIQYLVNDQEAYQFANQIETALNNNKWSTTFNAAIFEPPFSGIHFKTETNGDLDIQVGSNK